MFLYCSQLHRAIYRHGRSKFVTSRDFISEKHWWIIDFWHARRIVWPPVIRHLYPTPSKSQVIFAQYKFRVLTHLFKYLRWMWATLNNREKFTGYYTVIFHDCLKLFTAIFRFLLQHNQRTVKDLFKNYADYVSYFNLSKAKKVGC